VSPLAPWGERTGDDEAQSAVLAVATVLAAVTVFVLLVVRVNIVIAIVCPEPFERLCPAETHQRRSGVKQIRSEAPLSAAIGIQPVTSDSRFRTKPVDPPPTIR
jgi:hypothetical protein